MVRVNPATKDGACPRQMFLSVSRPTPARGDVTPQSVADAIIPAGLNIHAGMVGTRWHTARIAAHTPRIPVDRKLFPDQSRATPDKQRGTACGTPV